MRKPKENGPANVVRPFQPTIDTGTTSLTEDQRQTEALEHIATALSAIDHNLQVLATAIVSLANKK